jgi:hypothetical protein
MILALAVPALGYDTTWDGEPDSDICIRLSVDCYIQIIWQDIEIDFGENDFWCTVLADSAYHPCPDDDNQHPGYAWAGDEWYAGPGGRYYESYDGASVFVHSNNDIYVTIHTNGNLKGAENNGEIPTWFTLALAPFKIGGDVLDDEVGFPLSDEDGCYCDDANEDYDITYCDFTYPHQYCFPCDPASETWRLDLPAETEGTMKFLARINRHGMADEGDDYSTCLDVTFAEP